MSTDWVAAPDRTVPTPRITALELTAAAAACVIFTAFLTWPQVRLLGTTVAAHDDPLFSIWRISWIAHALRSAPGQLLDGNIFRPATGTLTFSDATLLEGVLAAPFLWAKCSPIVTYNVLLLGGIVTCGLAMFVLAREVVGGFGPALVAAAIFTMAPYRIEHYMHLELQWAMWVPLTFWALHRVFDAPSITRGAVVGLFVFLQAISCVYYAVFLTIACAAFVGVMAVSDPRAMRAALPALTAAALVAAVLIAPYLWPYVKTARLLGPRAFNEVARYSATPLSYLTAPPQNWLWGWTAGRWGHPELNLFAGGIVIALSLIGIFVRPTRSVAIYAAIALLGVELSFGTNGWLYPWLLKGGLQGLRSPSRYDIIVECALAMLAAFGVRALGRTVALKRWRGAIAAGAVLLVAVDYANAGMLLTAATVPGSTTVYRAMRSLGPGTVVELPMPAPASLPGREALFEFWSTTHWFPLVNGYSGYYPPLYVDTIARMRSFPDDQSIRRLRDLGVRYVVVHRALFAGDQADRLLARMAARPELKSFGAYKDPAGVAELWTLQ